MRTLMRLPGPRGRTRWPVKLLRALVGLLILILGYLGLFTFAGSLSQYPVVSPARPRTQLRGAFHIHTVRSDGRATPEEIAAAAKAADLQFVILTDHNPVDAPPPRYAEGVLLIFGAELSLPVGHLVALGLPRPVTAQERETQGLEVARGLGALTFLSHPIQKKRPWTDWEGARNATGLELYSADSMFRDAQRSPFSRFLPAIGAYLGRPIHGLMTVVGEQPEAADRLLQLSSDAPRVGICAHDAHGLPPYEAEFQTLSLYLPSAPGQPLAPDPIAAAGDVLRALGAGQAYCVFHALGEGSGFALEGLPAGAREVTVGSRLRVVPPEGTPVDAQVRVRGPATLLTDGRTVLVEQPGAVQIELWLSAPGRFFGREWKPWIVPSPVRVVPP